MVKDGNLEGEKIQKIVEGVEFIRDLMFTPLSSIH
jgi:hypothetical protein